MKIKLNYSLLVIFSLIVVLGEANYWAIYPKFITLTSRVVLLIAAAGLPSFIYCIQNNNKIKKKSFYTCFPWAIYGLCVLLNNQEIANGGYFNTLRIVVCLIMLFTCSLSYKWLKSAPKVMFLIGFPNVLATILFFINDGLYQKFVSFAYHGYQNGTSNGLYGYHAALADHYSQNGTYISIVFITIVAVFLSIYRNREKKIYLFLCVMSAIGLLLTTKRAHLIFSVIAIVILYYALNPKQIFTRTFKLIAILMVLLFAFNIAASVVPALADTFGRISSMGDDVQSTSRLVMWGFAFDYFKQNPIMGIGWYGFRYRNILGYASSSSGCHNIYFELLCETGIIGFSVFLICAISSLIRSFKNLSLDSKSNGIYRTPLAVSLVIQMFVIMYGMTGNALYDTTFYFYIIAVMINLTYEIHKESILEGVHNE